MAGKKGPSIWYLKVKDFCKQLVTLDACSLCGSFVYNQGKHYEFHKRLDEQFEAYVRHINKVGEIPDGLQKEIESETRRELFYEDLRKGLVQ